MIPTNPVASDDDGFDYYEDMPPLVYAGPLLGRCFTLYDNIGQNHSNIPYYHGHFPTRLITQNITAGSPSSLLQETNVQNRAVPSSRNSVGFPPLTPVLIQFISNRW